MTPRLKALLVVGGIVIAFAALLIGIALFQSPRTHSTVARDAPAAAAKTRAWAQSAKAMLIENGTITRFDCAMHEVQVNGLAWSMVVLDTKKQSVETLSRICEAEMGLGHVKLLDNRSGRTLAEFSVWSGITLH